MKMEHVWAADLAAAASASPSRTARPTAALLVIAVIAWLIAWYAGTVRSMVELWQSAEMYEHGFLIAPISLWLAWRMRARLSALELRPNLLAIPFLALTGFGWLLARLAGVNAVQQYALVVMIALAVWVIAGNGIARILAFPLSFLLLAVPFGDFALFPLMQRTADFTVLALTASGVPVYREGLYFVTPNGNWSLIEACSGLQYLIASATGGTLYAYLRYRTFRRRAIFVAAAVALPIVVNWIRTYLIVMVDYASDKQYSIVAHHVVFGWLLFGTFILLLFSIGALWREDGDVASPSDAMTLVPEPGRSMKAVFATAGAVAVLVAAWPVAASRLEQGYVSRPVLLSSPPVSGWKAERQRFTTWVPRFMKPSADIHTAYLDTRSGERAALFVGYYDNQRSGSELVSALNALVASDDREWRNVGEEERAVAANGRTIPAIEARLHGPSGRLLVWRWYWVDGHYTVNPYWAKLLQAKSRLLGNGGDGAVIIVYTDLDNDRDVEPPARTLQAFVGAMAKTLERSLENARQ